MDKVLSNLKADWDSMEESKVRMCAIETQFQGQSMVDECAKNFGCKSAGKKDAQ